MVGVDWSIEEIRRDSRSLGFFLSKDAVTTDVLLLVIFTKLLFMERNALEARMKPIGIQAR